MRLGLILLVAFLLTGGAGARDLLVVDASPSVARRDPQGLGLTAASLLVLTTDAARSLSIHDLSGRLIHDSPQRLGRSELDAARAALEGVAGRAAGSDLASALREIHFAESGREAAAGRLYLIGDGIPSLTREGWFGEDAPSLEAALDDPAAWLQSARRAYDRELAEVLGQLAGLGFQLVWVAPRGRPPGAQSLAAIRQSGGVVLAGGGIGDLERLLRSLLEGEDEERGGGWIWPLDGQSRELVVPPGTARLDVTFCKGDSASPSLGVVEPGGARELLGVGELARRATYERPQPGRWELRGGDGGIVVIELATELRLDAGEALRGAAPPGTVRTTQVALVDRAGKPVQLEAFDDIEMVARLGDELPVTLRRQGDAFRLVLRTPRSAGRWPYEIEATLRQGRWRETVRVGGELEVAEFVLDARAPEGLLPLGREVLLQVDARRDGRLWSGASGELTLFGAGEERPLPLVSGQAEVRWTPPAGVVAWRVQGDLREGDTRVPVEATGSFAVGRVELELDGQVSEGSWAGALEASWELPRAATVEIAWQPEGATAPTTFEQLILAPSASTEKRSFPLEWAPPVAAGRHSGRLVATVRDATGFPQAELPVTFVVRSAWERVGLPLLTVVVPLVALALLLGAWLWRRPRLQGEITVCDTDGTALGGGVLLAGLQPPLGARAVSVGSAPGDRLLLPVGKGVSGGQLVLRPRAGDLGQVFAVVENRALRPVRVSGTELAPGQSRVLHDGDTIAVGELTLRYRHPGLQDLVPA